MPCPSSLSNNKERRSSDREREIERESNEIHRNKHKKRTDDIVHVQTTIDSVSFLLSVEAAVSKSLSKHKIGKFHKMIDISGDFPWIKLRIV